MKFGIFATLALTLLASTSAHAHAARTFEPMNMPRYAPFSFVATPKHTIPRGWPVHGWPHHTRTHKVAPRKPVHHYSGGHAVAEHASGIITVQTLAKIQITVAAAVASKWQDLIADLIEHGYMPHDIGCYARGGHIPHSFHYRGLACDFDQDARNKTRGKFLYTKEARAVIREHGFDDGCDFGDCGHISLGEIGHAGSGRVYASRRKHYARRYRHKVHYARG